MFRQAICSPWRSILSLHRQVMNRANQRVRVPRSFRISLEDRSSRHTFVDQNQNSGNTENIADCRTGSIAFIPKIFEKNFVQEDQLRVCLRKQT